MDKRGSFPAILLVLLVVVLALLSPTCGTSTPCVCPLTSNKVITCSDSSVVTLWNGTNLTPCQCMDAQYYKSSDLPDPGCLPGGANVITAIDITPNGVTFSIDGRLDFRLPAGHGYAAGHLLTIWQHTTGICNPGNNQTNWSAEPGTASVIIGPPDIARGEHLRHTSIFALVEMRGRVSMLGTLVEPFTRDNGDIVATVEVLVSSTQPELQGALVKVRLAGIEGDPAQFMDILSKIPVGSMLALQLDDGNLLSIWWKDLIVRFYIKEILFQ